MPSFTAGDPSSFRDPSGFIFRHEGILYRQVNRRFQKDYDLFLSSGLYPHLVEKKMLVPHEELDRNFLSSGLWYKTIQPTFIPFFSYPYEWSFDMLKDAALLTLEVAAEAIRFGMVLKDASAYNVQLHEGNMIFIDTLSFEQYDQSRPWIAYRQFCEQFLAPLALMHYLKEPLQAMLLAYPEGIPLSLAGKLLPFRSKLNLHTYLHLHLHGSVAAKNQGNKSTKTASFSLQKMQNLLRSLREAVGSYSWNEPTGVWSGYYTEANERPGYVEAKKQIIDGWLQNTEARTAIDIGANEGTFSELLAGRNISVISADFDPYSINRLYRRVRGKQPLIHPLITDFSHPSPAIGLNNSERPSLLDRVQTDLVLALAVIHHLAIGKNIPFEHLVRMFASMGRYLLIEFVPKEDEKVMQMLEQKADVYDDYTEENFVRVFSRAYTIRERAPVGETKRSLYLMQLHG